MPAAKHAPATGLRATVPTQLPGRAVEARPQAGIGAVHAAQHALVRSRSLQAVADGAGSPEAKLELCGSPEELRPDKFPLKPTAPKGRRRNSVDNAACSVSPRARRTVEHKISLDLSSPE